MTVAFRNLDFDKTLPLDAWPAEAIETVIDRSCEEIRDHILARTRAWMRVQHDDMTVVVVRRTKAS